MKIDYEDYVSVPTLTFEQYRVLPRGQYTMYNNLKNKLFAKMVKSIQENIMGLEMNTERTDSYIGTFHYESAEDMLQLGEVRKMVTNMNKDLKRGGFEHRFYVKSQGRLGENNPNSKKYRRGGTYHNAQCVRLEDASRVDAYIYRR